MKYALVRELRARVAKELTVRRIERSQAGQPELSVPSERQLALTLIAEAIENMGAEHLAAGHPVPEGSRDGRLAKAVEAAIYGAGPLQPLLDDEDLENLDLDGYDEVWATYASRGRVRLDPVADSDEELVEILRAVASYAGAVARPWSLVHPQLDIGLPGGVRVSGLLAASARPQVSIRRDRLGPQAFLDEPPRRYPDALSLVELGTLDRQCAAFLIAAVRARANILIVGATNAGKTTLLRAMANAIPASERIVTIEQALELRLKRDRSLHPEVVELETVLPSPDGKGGLDGADLVRRSKRMNPDRLIFGEVLGGEEARAMLEAMLQGTDGSMSTIHARTAYGAVARLIINLGALREPIQPATAAALIGQAIDFVVYVDHGAGSRRVVTEILEISGSQGETVSHATIFASPEPAQIPGPFEPGPRERFGSHPRSGERADRPAGRSARASRTGSSSSERETRQPARRDPRIPLKRAALLARHGYTDELGERLNAEPSRSARSGARRHPAERSGQRRPSTSSASSVRPTASDVRDFTRTVAVPGRTGGVAEPVALPARSAHDMPPAPGEPAGWTAPTGSAGSAAWGGLEESANVADPAGIPHLRLEDPVHREDGRVSASEKDEMAVQAAVVARSTLHLPDDDHGPREPLAHGYQPETLTPAHHPDLLDEEPARFAASPSVSASDPISSDRPNLVTSPAGLAVSGLPRAGFPGSPPTGPVIDLGARRPDPAATGPLRGQTSLPGQDQVSSGRAGPRPWQQPASGDPATRPAMGTRATGFGDPNWGPEHRPAAAEARLDRQGWDPRTSPDVARHPRPDHADHINDIDDTAALGRVGDPWTDDGAAPHGYRTGDHDGVHDGPSARDASPLNSSRTTGASSWPGTPRPTRRSARHQAAAPPVPQPGVPVDAVDLAGSADRAVARAAVAPATPVAGSAFGRSAYSGTGYPLLTPEQDAARPEPEWKRLGLPRSEE